MEVAGGAKVKLESEQLRNYVVMTDKMCSKITELEGAVREAERLISGFVKFLDYEYGPTEGKREREWLAKWGSKK